MGHYTSLEWLLFLLKINVILCPDLRGLNETTWEHIAWHTVEYEKKSEFYYYISPDPPRNRCQDGIQCVRNLLEETFRKKMEREAGETVVSRHDIVTTSEGEMQGKDD